MAQTRVVGVDENGAGFKNYLEGETTGIGGINEITTKKCHVVLGTNEVLLAPPRNEVPFPSLYQMTTGNQATGGSPSLALPGEDEHSQFTERGKPTHHP